MRKGLGFHNRRSPGNYFTPAALFPSGTTGAWYDPSDASTLFSDTAGTTSSPTPGAGALSVVGLMLDKSQGLVLGPELIADYTQGYTASGTANVALSGAEVIATADGSSANPGYYYAISTVVGQQYYVTGVLRSPTTNTMYLAANSNTSVFSLISRASSFSASSTQVGFFFTAVGTTTYIFVYGSTSTVGNAYAARNISVKYRPGNHAISYNTTTARPELSARVNLLTYSEQFDNAAWTVQNATTANTTATTDPLGGNTADILTDNAVNTEHRVFQTPTNLADTYVWSFYAKANTLSWLHLGIPNAAGVRQDIYFDVGNGVKGTVPAGYTATITPAGSGWWRCTVTGATQANAYWLLATSTADNVQSYAGTGQSLYIWGADLRPANIGTSVPVYQRIADQYTYDSSGFPRYLVFNGTASGMYTPANLNLSGTDKATVFVGVRKTTTNTGVVAETSAIASSNNGAFLGLGTDSGGIEFFAGSRGTAYIDVFGDSASYTSPFSAVTTAAFNIAAPSAQLRVNAVVTETDVGSQGTGNYGSYPLNIGARNASSGTPSFFFPGFLYSLIVVGAASTAAQISSTESWINVKEGGVY